MKPTLIVQAAAVVALGSFAALATAQEGEALCTLPGLTVLEDATGDVDVQDSPVGIPLGYADIVSVSVAQPAQEDGVSRLVFTLKMAEGFPGPQLPPVASWYTSFKSPGGGFFGVRMNTGPDGEVAYQSYTLSASLDVDGAGGASDGRFADAAKAAESGSYGADGTITIVVKARDVGASKGGDMTQFNAGTVQRVGEESIGGAAFVLDGAPDDLSRTGAVAIAESPTCSAAAKAGSAMFGGSLGFGLLLPLLGLFGVRRRA